MRVLGTEFNIWADPDSDLIETTMVEGSVALYNDTNSTSLPDKILVPGEQALFDKQLSLIHI